MDVAQVHIGLKMLICYNFVRACMCHSRMERNNAGPGNGYSLKIYQRSAAESRSVNLKKGTELHKLHSRVDVSVDLF